MNSLPTDQSQHSSSDETASLVVKRRRRLLLGGASAPLLLTIASRPAWARGETCTPSALASANLSGQHKHSECGKSAGFWSQKLYAWPAEISHRTLFSDIFSVTVVTKGNTNYDFGPQTLGAVINLTGNESPYKLGLHAVGALVNSYAYPQTVDGRGFRYSTGQVISMFNQYAGSQPDYLASLFKSANEDSDEWSSWPH